MNKFKRSLASIIFASRWLQAPLYLGLMLALGIYVYDFMLHLVGLIRDLHSLDETQIMMRVLDLIDVVMIANLLIMVIVGGFEIFVSRLNIHNHPDSPEWLGAVNAGTMKVKLATALISISSIHLLKIFFDVGKMSSTAIMWQVLIHLTLLISAVAIAIVNKCSAGDYASRKSSNKSQQHLSE